MLARDTSHTAGHRHHTISLKRRSDIQAGVAVRDPFYGLCDDFGSDYSAEHSYFLYRMSVVLPGQIKGRTLYQD